MQIFSFIVVAIVVSCASVARLSSARAADFPIRPIRIVTSEPGGGLDFAARLIAQGVSGPIGQALIVENRGGAGGSIAIETVAKAQPDGYTLLLYGSTIWLVPFMRDRVTYDPVRDFAPVTLATISPNILVLNPAVPANSVKEFISLARAKPGELNYGSGALGASSHLAAELFKAMAGVNLTRVPYKGSGPALIGLVAGQVQVMFATAGGVSPHIKAGRLKALAVSTAQPSALFPGLPTIAASGLPGYESASMGTIFAPAKTPGAVIKRLNTEIVRYLHTPEAREKFLAGGVETVGSSPEQLAATMKAEMTRLGKVIKDAGIREE
jgi:tripartite-type tricarboxylate transporter receptor subunit TctC